jgi:hypothetical protein
MTTQLEFEMRQSECAKYSEKPTEQDLAEASVLLG